MSPVTEHSQVGVYAETHNIAQMITTGSHEWPFKEVTSLYNKSTQIAILHEVQESLYHWPYVLH